MPAGAGRADAGRGPALMRERPSGRPRLAQRLSLSPDAWIERGRPLQQAVSMPDIEEFLLTKCNENVTL